MSANFKIPDFSFAFSCSAFASECKLNSKANEIVAVRETELAVRPNRVPASPALDSPAARPSALLPSSALSSSGVPSLDAGYDDVTVIIPTLNEQDNIALLVSEITELCPGISVLVVDDASEDETANRVRAVVSNRGRVSLYERRDVSDRGITASVLEGISHCTTDFFLVMDGDFQHPPSLIVECVQALREDADLVIAYRRSVAKEYSIFRRGISYIATAAAHWRLDQNAGGVRDPLSGCFGGSLSTIRPLLQSNPEAFVRSGYKILFDLLKLIAANNSSSATSNILVIKEVAYDFGVRSKGSSKFRAKHMLCFLAALLRPVRK